MHRLGGDDHQVANARVRRARRCVYLYGAVAGRALDAQSVLADRLDVLAPGVARPHFVARGGEQSGVHGPHRSSTDDGDFHLIDI